MNRGWENGDKKGEEKRNNTIKAQMISKRLESPTTAFSDKKSECESQGKRGGLEFSSGFNCVAHRVVSESCERAFVSGFFVLIFLVLLFL